MKYYLVIAGLALSGCTTTAVPTLDHGNYYMTGDPACKIYQAHMTDRYIICKDAKGKPTERRNAMSPEQMQMYAYQQQAAQAQQMSYQPQPMQVMQYPTMQTPQPVQLNPGSNQVRCISTGIYMNCR